MSERKYTLSELDAMRKLIGKKLPQPLYEHFCPANGGWSRQTEASERSVSAFKARIEDQLRTAIIAGLGPEDFVEQGEPK